MEFQLAPVRRQAPVPMPWVDEYRAAVGGGSPPIYVADGQVIRL
jgi:hypothetical protein